MSFERAQILVVDDEEDIRKIVVAVLEKERFAALAAQDGKTALQQVRLTSPDLIILDLVLPDLDGLEVLRQVHALDADLPVVILTGHAEVAGAVAAMRVGAHDYLAKPFESADLLRVVHRALEERRLKLKLKQLARQINTNQELTAIMGPSDVIGGLIADVNRVAKSDFSVVIIGETGSGKEVVARAIHQSSPRASHPFIPVDCGAIPESLLEGELFGYERGAFTGAVGSKRGKFELAHGGTLFLDEILNLPLASQAKLLRALQEKMICRLGSSVPVHVNVRVLVAANQDLERAMASGVFRHDLFFRLNEFTLKIPALRDRPDDIPYLAKRFLDLTNRELGKAVKGFDKSALHALLCHDWPGNVRQLRSAIRRAVLLANELITDSELEIGPFSQGGITSALEPAQAASGPSAPLHEIVAKQTMRLEREVIGHALNWAGGNKAKAARALRIDYKTMLTKMKKYGINLKMNSDHENQNQPR